MRYFPRVISFIIFSLVFSATANATRSNGAGVGADPTLQSGMIDLSAKGARVHKRPEARQALTSPSADAPGQIVRNFLQANNLRSSAAASLRTSSEFVNRKSGLTHVRMSQEVGGLSVYGTYVRAAVNGAGEIVHLMENVVQPARARVMPSQISSEEALSAALARHYPSARLTPSVMAFSGNKTTFSKNTFFYSEPTATRVAIPMQDGTLEEGFLVETWDNDNILKHTLVNRFGRVIKVEVRTNFDSYNIFPDNPGDTPQTVVPGPGAGNAESPVGWVFSDTTTGNNVDAYLDADANNTPDIGGRPASVSQDFLAVADLASSPATATNREVAVQNLFYLNNVIHDKLYQHGFTEATGNFQEDNFGLGGFGSDSVNAEAQDGGGTNNANFATPPDGSNPRMQMYVWTQSTPSRDGDLESDIVWHEYGHGLTWRMIGSMSLSGAIGEGMSDVLALLANENDVMGAWSVNNPGGIRRYPYSVHPLTYGDVLGNSVHQDGEIYAATIWGLWERWQIEGLPKEELYDYLIGGMNFTPPAPSYEDMRDGILSAISDTAIQCIVWEAFADKGIGEGALGVNTGGSVSITESFALPGLCLEDDSIVPDPVTDFAIDGVGARSATFSWTTTGDDGSTGNATGFDLRYSTAPITAANFDIANAASGLPISGPPGTLQTATVTGLLPDTHYYFAIKVLDNVNNASDISNIVSTTTQPVQVLFFDDMESGASNWTVSGTLGPNGEPLWHLAGHRFNSPTTAFYYGIDGVLNYNTGAANSGAMTSIPIDLLEATDASLSFRYFLRTENLSPYDAASVEISADGGATWQQVFLTSLSTPGSGMVEEVIDISGFDGQLIQLRFSFATLDSAVNDFEGWVLDDVGVTATEVDVDTDGDGLPNSEDPDDDNDGVPDESDAFPLDPTESVDTDSDGVGDNADAFPTDPTETVDSDGDGVGDNADAFPTDSTETVDSDGDGVGDNADVFPSDPTESADTDGDGVGDNADAFPADPTETIDTDGDGTGNNTDIDDDNDGLPDSTEYSESSSANISAWPALGQQLSSDANTLVFNDGGSVFPRQANSVNLSAYGFSDNFRVSWVVDSAIEEYGFGIGLGVTETGADMFDIDYGFWIDSGSWGSFDNSAFHDVWGGLINGTSVMAMEVASGELSYVVDGVIVHTVSLASTPDFYIDTVFFAGDLAVRDIVVESLNGSSASDPDEDGDGVENILDLDSDNDAIPDVIEAGLVDADGNLMVDVIGDQGTVIIAPDSDLDGIPDFLDLESTNPANDGTAYDIATTVYAVLDVNADGQINSGDTNGGTDVNGNGVDDLLEGPDTDGDLYPDVVDAFPADPTEWLDTDGDGVGDNGDAFPSDPTESADTDGDGVGDNADAFPSDPAETADSDGDGVGDNGDIFPSDPAESADHDLDGVGDNADTDDDNDGIADDAEVFGSSETLLAEHVAGLGYARSERVQFGLGERGVFGASTNTLPTGFTNPLTDGRSGGKASLGFIADSGRDGFASPDGYDGDYFLPGTAEETFSVEVDGVARGNSAHSTLFEIPGAVVGSAVTAGTATVTWQGNVSGLSVQKSARLYSDGLLIQHEITLTNETASPLSQIYFMNNVDPDNDHSVNNSFATLNTVRAQGDVSLNNLSHVSAEHDSSGAGSWAGVEAEGASLAYVSYDARARVTRGGFTNRSPSGVYNATSGLIATVGSSASGDTAISIAFNVGVLAPGEATTLVYYYHFGHPDDLSEVELAENNLLGGDTDGDGVSNHFDLDSDNDSIPDIIEAGLVDADGDFIVDDPAQQGGVLSPPDSDGDGLPDFIDLESTNPLNDGTAYDIATTGFAAMDSNGDGMISALDADGGVDANNNGVDDLVEFAPDADGDGFPDSVDAFPSDPTEWLDSDADGVGDNVDVFPNDPAETMDSDGDGVGDNGDAFPSDSSESADSDGDGVGDNADAFPTDPAETMDTDGDGIGNNTDIDIDNDGIANDAEGAAAIEVVDWPELGSQITVTDNTLVFADGGSVFPRQANSTTFSNYGFSDEYQVTWTFTSTSPEYGVAIGLGVAENGADMFDVDYGFWYDSGNWGTYDNGAFHDFWGEIVSGVTVFGIEVIGGQLNYLVDGLIVHSVTLASTPDFYVDSVFFSGDISVDGFLIEALGGVLSIDSDYDGDGIDNAADLDSDNDTIPDIVEAGLIDSDGNYMVDLLSDQGFITTAPDSDADGIPDHLDLESFNAANDGTAFDILSGGYSSLDSNGDGQINASDADGGNDVNGNGVDDLIEP